MSNEKAIKKLANKLYKSDYQLNGDWGRESDEFADTVDECHLNRIMARAVIGSAVRMVHHCQEHAFKYGFALGVKHAAELQSADTGKSKDKAQESQTGKEANT